jgi:hypothetical protein
MYPNDPQYGDEIINWQQLFLAMTEWQLGRRDEARQLLSKIKPAMDEEVQSLATAFNYRLTLEVLRREAETLIQEDPPGVAANRNESTPLLPPSPGPQP